MTVILPIHPIDSLLRAFEAGDVVTMLDMLADDVDFRIDHYRDDFDFSWQSASSKAALLPVIQRLASDIFPKGTRILKLETSDLGGGWAITRFHQRFFHGQSLVDTIGETLVLSHFADGQCDYFRETVTAQTPTF